jgi:hypothetical protein
MGYATVERLYFATEASSQFALQRDGARNIMILVNTRMQSAPARRLAFCEKRQLRLKFCMKSKLFLLQCNTAASQSFNENPAQLVLPTGAPT